MKNLSKFLVLIIGLSAFRAAAQNADSVIVIYDNQKTIVPLPAFGSQTSVSYADTNKVVEIGVWLRKPGEISPFSQFLADGLTVAKPKKKSKWFSQVQAGYSLEFAKAEGERTRYRDVDKTSYTTEQYSLSNGNGYQLMLSVYEKENQINKKYTFSSGFNFGYEQYFFNAKSFLTERDASGNQIMSQDSICNIKQASFNLLYNFGISYHFKIKEMPSRINLGNCLGITTMNLKIGEYKFGSGRLYFTFLQPYLGIEIGKVGVLFSADFHAPDVQDFPYPIIRYGADNSNRIIGLRGSVAFSVTYRIF
jgi:hypothetical protein